MSLLVNVEDGNWAKVRRNFQRLGGPLLGPSAEPTFANVTLTDLTASEFVMTDASKGLVSLAVPILVNKGGTGLTTITNHGLMLGSGTGAVTVLAEATNGQIPIGSTGADPVLAELTGTANQVTVTNGAGSITLSAPQDIHTGASPTFAGATIGALDGIIIGTAGVLSAITDNSANWDTAYGWGDHDGLYSLLGHLHGGDTLECDGINSDGGAFTFTTSGAITFSQSLIVPDDGSIGVVDGTPSIVFDDTSGNAELSGGLDMTGVMSLGDAAHTITIGLYYYKSWNMTAVGDNVTRYGSLFALQAGKSAAADYTGNIKGVFTQVQLDSVNTQDWTSSLGIMGVHCDMNVEGSSSGTVTGMAGLYVTANIQDAATVTNFYGVKIGLIQAQGTPHTLVNEYGIYINNIDAGTTLNYAIYTNDGLVRFGGAVSCASTFESVGVATLADGSLLKTSAAPTTDAMIANKKYVDDQVSGGTDEKVKIDAAATAGYIGAASNDGVLRTGTGLSYTDGGDFVTLDLDINALTADASPVGSTDYVATYDATASTEKKVLLDNFHRFVDRGDPASTDYDETTLTLDGTWNDLDLSSIVPANAVAVALATVIKDNAVGSRVKFRKNGNSNTINVSQAYVTVANVFSAYDQIVACDSNRVIEYEGTSGTDSFDVTVKGWWLG